MIPVGTRILLAADRFYGHPKLIGYCQKKGWQYRVRLKGNLTLLHRSGELSVGELLELPPQGIEGANLCGSGVTTSIGVLHEEGHGEPWSVAMDGRPTPGRVLDCGMRWGIETMFSDWKTRGFSISTTRLKRADRIARLPVLMPIACHCAVSTALRPDPNRPKYSPKKSSRCRLSLLQRGLRLIRTAFANGMEIPPLWRHVDSFHW